MKGQQHVRLAGQFIAHGTTNVFFGRRLLSGLSAYWEQSRTKQVLMTVAFHPTHILFPSNVSRSLSA